jgi:DNA (cytosine-5)-methyltransferase 1
MLRVGTLFSGIETPVLALERMGIPFEHTYSCEIDRSCRLVIAARFAPLALFGDIEKVDARLFPETDLVIAGIPCQSFSQAGYHRGFKDARGNLFWSFARVLDAQRPKVFILENVKSLLSHDGGKTFSAMAKEFERLGYSIAHQLLDSSQYGVPQMRQRVYVVGYQTGDPDAALFSFPESVPLRVTLDDIMGGKVSRALGFTLRVGGRSSGIDNRHNWDEYQVDGETRPLSVREACLLQGIPGDFYGRLGVAIPDREAFKQIGNSMTVDVVGAVIGSVVFGGARLSDGTTEKRTKDRSK